MKFIKNHINNEDNKCLCKLCRTNRALTKEKAPSSEERAAKVRKRLIERERADG